MLPIKDKNIKNGYLTSDTWRKDFKKAIIP